MPDYVKLTTRRWILVRENLRIIEFSYIKRLLCTAPTEIFLTFKGLS